MHLSLDQPHFECSAATWDNGYLIGRCICMPFTPLYSIIPITVVIIVIMRFSKAKWVIQNRSQKLLLPNLRWNSIYHFWRIACWFIVFHPVIINLLRAGKLVCFIHCCAYNGWNAMSLKASPQIFVGWITSLWGRFSFDSLPLPHL